MGLPGWGFQRWLESLARDDFTGSTKVFLRENTVSIALIYGFYSAVGAIFCIDRILGFCYEPN